MSFDCKTFAIIGGDKRQLYCARQIADDGYEVILGGFDKVLSMRGVSGLSEIEAIEKSDAVILPLPCVDKDGYIPSAFSDKKISVKELEPYLCTKRVFCGMKDKLLSFTKLLNPLMINDYYEREDFVLANAYVTAEGAISIAMEKFEGTLNGTKILVCGFGRIGKALVTLLKGFNPDLTVSARKPQDLTAIRIAGAKAVHTRELLTLDKFDIIFSTVPSMIFECDLMAKIATDALLIDLASAKGSVDYEAAKRLGIDAIHALSLPGKSAPKTAGKIIKDTVYTILEEEHR